MESMSDKNRKLIKALELIGDYELMKPVDEIDGDLIDATVNWSLRLQNKDITLSTEEIEKMVSMIPFDDTEELETNGEVHKSKKVLKKNKVLFIAAIIAILVTLLTIVSVAFEWNIFEELKNRFGTVADTPVNEEIVVDGQTIYMIGENKNYSSIESIFEKEKIKVLFPSELPDDSIIEEIVLYSFAGKEKISFVTNDNSLIFDVVFDQTISKEIKDVYDVLIIENLICYVCDMADLNCTQLYFEYDGNTYFISFVDKQELIRVVKNLKELG